MKISVVTVSFNAAATIADTIASVQAQDHAELEHIVIDGASTDGTQAIVDRMADHRTVFVSEPDRGLYDAMNKGIARASGDVIGILNADDFYAHASVLSHVAACFAEASPVDAVLGDLAFLAHDPAERRLGRRYRSRRFRPGRIAWGWMPAHPSMFVTRDAYSRVGPYRTDYRISADYEFVARAFGRYGLSYRHLEEILVLMRPGGISTRGVRSKWIINVESVRACRDNGIRSNLLMIMTKYPLKILDRFVSVGT